MDRETLKNQYLEYIKNKLSTVFSVGTWFEHETGANLDADEHEVLVGELVNEVSKDLPSVIGGSNS